MLGIVYGLIMVVRKTETGNHFDNIQGGSNLTGADCV
jgi:hypothetical protein